MSSRRVTVSVHQRTDTEGFVARLVVEDGEVRQVAKYPTSTQEEAEALAESIKGYIEAGCDPSPLLAETGDWE